MHASSIDLKPAKELKELEVSSCSSSNINSEWNTVTISESIIPERAVSIRHNQYGTHEAVLQLEFVMLQTANII